MKRLLSFLTMVSITSCSTAELQNRTISSVSSSDMEYVDVCDRQGSCKKFSRLILGTDHLAASDWTSDGQPGPSDEMVHEVLDEAVRLGINIFDTSPIYVGSIEYKIGKWLKSREQAIQADSFYYSKESNPDRKLYTISKGGFPFDLYWSKSLPVGTHSKRLKEELQKQGILDPKAPLSPDGSTKLSHVPPGTYASRLFGEVSQIKERVFEEIKNSLSQLNDSLTIYLMHRDDGDFIKFNPVERKQTSVKSIMQALAAPEISSKYWMVGWSNWRTDRINESIKLSGRNANLPKPAMNSPYFSLFEMSERAIHAGGIQVTHSEMMDPNFQKGIKQMSYSPLGGFSIFDKPEPRWDNAKQVAKEKYDKGDPYWQNVFKAIFTEVNKARFERLVDFTNRFNTKHGTSYTLDQMANAYALAHKRADFITVGPITVEQLRRTVGSLKLSHMLTLSDLEYLHNGK